MKGMGATGGIGGRARATLTRTGIEFGLDIGIGQIGISTDYGGGIVVGIAGQKIVWGREGGTIHYNVGGLEVRVEARDCVVVETRKIAGIVVSIHTYPDPGCKLPPDPPASRPPLTPLTPTGKPLRRQCGDGYWESAVFYDKSREARTGANLIYVQTSLNYRDYWVTSLEDYIKWIEDAENASPNNDAIATSWHGRTDWIKDIVPQPFTPGGFSGNVYTHPYFVGLWQYVDANNPGTAIPRRVNSEVNSSRPIARIQRSYSREMYRYPGQTAYFVGGKWCEVKHTILDITDPPECRILFVPKLLPTGGNQPPMPDRCCEALQADIEDIKTVLAVESLLKKKVEIPGELMEIQTEGTPTAKSEIILNYIQMAHAILLTINRYGIDAPIKVQIEDSDTTKKGNQSDEFTYNSGAVALQAILELLWEIKGDSASRLKIQVRIAYVVTRILKIVAGVSESVRTLIKMIGLPFRYDKKKLPLEFNLVAAKRKKGFGREVKKGTSLTESEVEALLPNLLEETEYEVPAPVFDAKNEDIRELLVKIYIALQALPKK
jgi:hypothetical protein